MNHLLHVHHHHMEWDLPNVTMCLDDHVLCSAPDVANELEARVQHDKAKQQSAARSHAYRERKKGAIVATSVASLYVY